MADPTAASLNQLRNIQGKTGKTIGELHALLDGTGLAKHGEKRTWLIDNLGLGYGDANAVVGAQGKGEVFDGATLTIEDDRMDYGETRYITIGFLNERMVVLVWTPRGDVRRQQHRGQCAARDDCYNSHRANRHEASTTSSAVQPSP